MINKIHLILLFLLCIATASFAQEICDNGIDDDGDGLIDLNDWSDCKCDAVSPTSLIPNPSFEEMTCCPTENEQLNCAVGWIQASPPTTDYVHTCGGYLGNASINAVAPLPFADGEGGVGFRDGQMNIGAIYKEYVGACLTEVMEVGATYRLDFYVGFQDERPGSMNFDIALFASADCNNLPFGTGNNVTIGCPTNVNGYTELGEQYVSGSNEWVNVVFEFVANEAYEVIVLGPSCALNQNYLLDPYFYVDRLTLAAVSSFGTAPLNTSGAICEEDLILEVADDPANTYQWYQDGIALLGETNASLELDPNTNTEGNYQVFIIGPDDCELSVTYPLLIPPYYVTVEERICENEYYLLGTDTLSESGMYEGLLLASDGCDSIVQLSLEVLQGDTFYFEDIVCENEGYFFFGRELLEAGVYDTIVMNFRGCDSLVVLELSHLSFGIGLDLPTSVSIKLGELVNLVPSFYDSGFTEFLWTDETGIVLGEEVVLSDYQPFVSTRVYLELSNPAGCILRDTMDINVLPNYGMYVPNAFSPDGNGINDFFRFYPGISVAGVSDFSIFNRWGGLVFRNQSIINFQNYEGWDGNVKGEEAQVGVYTYLLELEYLDGVRELLSGDVTLLR